MTTLLLPLFFLVCYFVPFVLRLMGVEDPATWIVCEDGVYETIGALCSLAASLTFLYTYIALPRDSKSGLFRSRRSPWVLLLSATLFVLFGEEISWGQRVHEMDTPMWLVELNQSEELNFHNIYWGMGKDVQGGMGQTLFLMAVVANGILLGVLPILTRVSVRMKRVFEWLDLPIPSLGVALAINSVGIAAVLTGSYLLNQESSELVEIAVECLFFVYALEVFVKFRSQSSSVHNKRLTALLVLCVSPIAIVLAYDSMKDREPIVFHLVNLAMVAIQQEQYDQAMEYLHEAIATQPDDVRTLGVMAQVEYRRNNLQAAAEIMEEAIRQNPTNSRLHHRLAALRHEQGALDLAAISLDRSLELSPNNTEALILYSIVLAQQGRVAEAQQRIDKALEIKPEDPAVRDLHQRIHQMTR